MMCPNTSPSSHLQWGITTGCLDGSIRLTWRLTPVSVQKEETRKHRCRPQVKRRRERERERKKKDLWFYRRKLRGGAIATTKISQMKEKTKACISDRDVDSEFCLNLSSPSRTSIISNSPLQHRLSADGFIHLTWQPTSENCFGVTMGQSQKKERQKYKETENKSSEWLSSLLFNTALMMNNLIKNKYWHDGNVWYLAIVKLFLTFKSSHTVYVVNCMGNL